MLHIRRPLHLPSYCKGLNIFRTYIYIYVSFSDGCVSTSREWKIKWKMKSKLGLYRQLYNWILHKYYLNNY